MEALVLQSASSQVMMSVSAPIVLTSSVLAAAGRWACIEKILPSKVLTKFCMQSSSSSSSSGGRSVAVSDSFLTNGAR